MPPGVVPEHSKSAQGPAMGVQRGSETDLAPEGHHPHTKRSLHWQTLATHLHRTPTPSEIRHRHPHSCYRCGWAATRLCRLGCVVAEERFSRWGFAPGRDELRVLHFTQQFPSTLCPRPSPNSPASSLSPLDTQRHTLRMEHIGYVGLPPVRSSCLAVREGSEQERQHRGEQHLHERHEERECDAQSHHRPHVHAGCQRRHRLARRSADHARHQIAACGILRQLPG